ncbi:MAG: gliding motility-associated C-terminal domain-containing protein, partial [Saprospiraceae bacterium]
DSTIWNDNSVGKYLKISKSGIFWGSFQTLCGILSDSISVKFISPPNIDLGVDRVICPNQFDTIWSNDVNTIWQDGSVSPYFIINKSGIISATIKSRCGDVMDSIKVSYYSNTPFSLPKDTLLCTGETITLSSPSDSTTWNDGTVGKNLIADKPGLYWAEVKSFCNTIRDSILISYQSIPFLDLGSDRQICPNEVDTIWSFDKNTIWQDGSSGPYYVIRNSEVVVATINNICGLISDSLQVFNYPDVKIQLPSDTTLCEGNTLLLTSPSDSTMWSSGQIGKEILVNKDGKYWATIISPCDAVSDTILVNFISKPNLDLGPDHLICPNSNDTVWSFDNNTIWNDGSSGPFYIIRKPEIVIATTGNICGAVSDTIVVNYIPDSNIDLGPDKLICEGEVDTIWSNSDLTVWDDGTKGRFKVIRNGGIHWASIISNCGIRSDSVLVTIQPVFSVPALSKDTTLCELQTFELSVPFIDEIWNDQYLNKIVVDHPGIYKYTYMDICNYIADSISVTYDSIPKGFPLNDMIICGQEGYTFNTGNKNTEWSNGTLGSEITIKESMRLSYRISNQCGIFADTINLTVINDQAFYVPNVFSPNDDNVNDEFPGPSVPFPFTLEIYDRWGARLFKGFNKGWNGKFKDNMVNPGVYVYIIRHMECKDQIEYGSVTLLR